MLIDVLSGEQPPPSDTNATKKIENAVEAVTHTNFLPPLKGTSLELCKIGHMMEGAYGKQLLQISDEWIRIQMGYGQRVFVLYVKNEQIGIVCRVEIGLVFIKPNQKSNM